MCCYLQIKLLVYTFKFNNLFWFSSNKQNAVHVLVAAAVLLVAPVGALVLAVDRDAAVLHVARPVLRRHKALVVVDVDREALRVRVLVDTAAAVVLRPVAVLFRPRNSGVGGGGPRSPES
jgi:hypothetical protein